MKKKLKIILSTHTHKHITTMNKMINANRFFRIAYENLYLGRVACADFKIKCQHLIIRLNEYWNH